eukprot:6309179-Prymnesium_polylepis.1
MSSIEGLDLAAGAADVLQAAEVALLAHRLNLKRESSNAVMAKSHRPPSAARAWVNCVDLSFCRALLVEAQLLVTQPGGGWTHWLEPTAAPRCALEALALHIMRFHCAGAVCRGVEWWVQ